MFWYSPSVSVRSNSWLTRQLLEFLIFFDTILDFNGIQCSILYFGFESIQNKKFYLLQIKSKHSLDFIRIFPNWEIFYQGAGTGSGKMIISQSARADNIFPDLSKISKNENWVNHGFSRHYCEIVILLGDSEHWTNSTSFLQIIYFFSLQFVPTH